jgi:hypothetical protein
MVITRIEIKTFVALRIAFPFGSRRDGSRYDGRFGSVPEVGAIDRGKRLRRGFGVHGIARENDEL